MQTCDRCKTDWDELHPIVMPVIRQPEEVDFMRAHICRACIHSARVWYLNPQGGDE